MKQIPIVVFKAITGEFGIGVLNKEEKKIEKVLLIALKAPAGEHVNLQKPQIIFIPPFSPFSENLPSISLSHVIMYEEVTNEELTKLYFMASTNLALPDTKTITSISKNPVQSKANIINFNAFARKES